MVSKNDLLKAIKAIENADYLLITSGAGIGVDSGLPDYRGDNGFWQAYKGLGSSHHYFEKIASSDAFAHSPEIAWGFYAHRLLMYRNTEPHTGFKKLLKLGESMEKGCFSYTSNVDGQFQKVGFKQEQIFECHGSLHHLQCIANCKGKIWSAKGFEPEIDAEKGILLTALPRCPDCGRVARPNVLMFVDHAWQKTRNIKQHQFLNQFLQKTEGEKRLVIEIGAGTALPAVRYASERYADFLIRINPTESQMSVNQEGLSLDLGGLEAINLLLPNM